jgi:predicted DNA-binding protein (UPF0251 family)
VTREDLLWRLLAHSRVDSRGCRIWQLSIKHGYGQVSVDGVSVYAHRAAYEVFVGRIPDGLQVLHTCDVRPCIEPTHLFLGTQLDNVVDMWTKGRGKLPPIHIGEAHPLVTIADVEVAAIRLAFYQGQQQRDLAARYRCSQATISRFVNHVTRATAPDPVGDRHAQLSLLEIA